MILSGTPQMIQNSSTQMLRPRSDWTLSRNAF